MSDRQKGFGMMRLRGGGPGALIRPVEKPRDFKGTFLRLAGCLKPRLVQLVVVFIMAVFSTAFAVFSPRVLGNGITRIFDGSMKILKGVPGAGLDFPYILKILIILAGLYAAGAFFNYLMHFVMAGVAQKTIYDLRSRVMAKMSRLPLEYFDTHSTGDILSRVTNDMDNIASTLQQSLTQSITAVISLVGIIIMMLTISPLLTLVSVVTLPLSFLATRKIAGISRKHFTRQQELLGKLNGHVEEMYTGHGIVKAFGQEARSLEIFQDINGKLVKVSFKAQFLSGIIMPVMSFINNTGYVFIAVTGGILVTRRMIAIGDIQAFIQYSRQFFHPILQVSNMANILQSALASAERVFEILDQGELSPEADPPWEAGRPRGEVSFRNVKFGYTPGKVLMKNVSLTARPGQTLAIVGPTGAGKTTLVNLLMRFYEVDGGEIRVDGVDIKNFERGQLRRLFGMVLQDAWLFNGTIRENIAYGREGASEEDIRTAARAAGSDHFIRTLPNGYDTILNEEITNISQGQKQLLTIARAILADPPILILDEATSNVDTRTEIHIQKAMEKLMKGRTSFIIAHRLSTIKNADRILFMNEGDILEQGTHGELIKAGGFYAELYQSQFPEI